MKITRLQLTIEPSHFGDAKKLRVEVIADGIRHEVLTYLKAKNNNEPRLLLSVGTAPNQSQLERLLLECLDTFSKYLNTPETRRIKHEYFRLTQEASA